MLALVVFSMGAHALAASCCGGGSTSIPILSNDHNGLVRMVAQGVWTDRDADASGRLRSRTTQSSTVQMPLQISAATLLADRLQIGASFRWADRPGDLMAMVTYEAVTDRLYHPLRPRVLPFFQFTLPTGVSVFDAPTGILPSGQGFTVFNVGIQIEKDWGDWAVSLTPQAALRAPRFGIAPGPVLSAGLQITRRFQDVVLGFLIEPAYQGTRTVQLGSLSTQTGSQFQLLGSAFASIEVMDQTRAAIMFQEGALFNLAYNQAVERILSFSLSKTFLR